MPGVSTGLRVASRSGPVGQYTSARTMRCPHAVPHSEQQSLRAEKETEATVQVSRRRAKKRTRTTTGQVQEGTT
eukprot:3826276-Rhodomonas_salina.3